jgi:hypothetical protein
MVLLVQLSLKGSKSKFRWRILGPAMLFFSLALSAIPYAMSNILSYAIARYRPAVISPLLIYAIILAMK